MDHAASVAIRRILCFTHQCGLTTARHTTTTTYTTAAAAGAIFTLIYKLKALTPTCQVASLFVKV